MSKLSLIERNKKRIKLYKKFKVKHDKLEALRWWSKIHPVFLFVYDSHKDRHSLLSLDDLTKRCKESDTESFPEGKPYFAIKSSLIWGDV